MTDYLEVLLHLYSDSAWRIDGNNYSDLVWLDDSPKPSQDTLDDAWPQVEHDRAYADVEQARRAEYVSDTDPLFFKWQRGDGTERAWLDAVQAVKAAHPYPDAP